MSFLSNQSTFYPYLYHIFIYTYIYMYNYIHVYIPPFTGEHFLKYIEQLKRKQEKKLQ